MLPLVETGEDPSLDDQADNGDSQRGNEESHPETGRSPSKRLRHTEGHEGTNHIERTVSHVWNPENPKDETQARCDNEEDRRPAQTYQDLAEDAGRKD